MVENEKISPNNIEVYDATTIMDLEPWVGEQLTNLVVYILDEEGKPQYLQALSLRPGVTISTLRWLIDKLMGTPISEFKPEEIADDLLVSRYRFQGIDLSYKRSKESEKLIADKYGYYPENVISDEIRNEYNCLLPFGTGPKRMINER